MTKKFFKTGIQPLLTGWDAPAGCFASDRIMVEGHPIGYMYREMPDDDTEFSRSDSGWRFFAGDENDEEVPELLKAVVGGEVAQGRGAQVCVGQQGVPGVGQDLPRGWNQALPRPGTHEEGDVHDAVEQPEAGGYSVPGTTQPDLGPTGQGH